MENKLLTAKDQEIESLKNEIRELKEQSEVDFWINKLDVLMLNALTENIKFKTDIQEVEDMLVHSVNVNERISSNYKEQLEGVLDNFKEFINEIEKSRASAYSFIYELFPCLTTPRQDEKR